MKRAKPPKKKHSIDKHEINRIAMLHINRARSELKQECIDELMELTMPVFMLACKDEFKATHTQLENLGKRMDRYFNYIADKAATIDDVNRILEEAN